MITSHNGFRSYLACCVLPLLLLLVPGLFGAPAARAADAPKVAPAAPAKPLVPLNLYLPPPKFHGTPPAELAAGPHIEPLSDKPRPPMMVPPGLTNVALTSKLTCSDTNANGGMLAKIIDTNKEAYDEDTLYLRKGLQHVQMDLGSTHEIFAVALWHAHNVYKLYHDVIVQAADDPAFAKGVRTLFNNDQDNSAGLGIGTDREYFETREGKLLDAKGVKARYLRFYSKGSTESSMNEYTEIEVYARPAK